MADYRKWLGAFAGVAILLGFAPTALAVTEGPPLVCTATSAPRNVRGEGVAELTGDIILTCSGGSPTEAGQPVALASVHVQLQVPITSRTLGTAHNGSASSTSLTSEAMLLVDEPFPSTPFPTGIAPIPGSPLEQIGCVATGGQVAASSNPYTGSLSGNVGQCEILGDGTGAFTYASYNETSDGEPQYNMFEGITTKNLTTGLATIDFNGVPLDPPGSANERIIRITNIRGDMTGLLGPTNSANGVPVVETVSISGSTNFTVPASIVTVAYVFQGLQAGGVSGNSYPQCQSLNNGDFAITFAEGFVSSFKTRMVTDTDAVTGSSTGGLTSLRNDEDMTWEDQNIPFMNYYTETGFTPTPDNDFPLNGPNNGTDGTNDIGVADTGTRFLITVTNLQNGVSVDFPAAPTPDSGSPNLQLWLVPNANADGTGGTAEDGTDVVLSGSWTAGGSATSQFVVYEVVADDPTQQESVTVSPNVSYAANLATPVPALGPNSTNSVSYATVSFAPIAADRPGAPLPTNNKNTNTTSRGSLPRFISTAASPSAAITIYACSCNLLYPWIVGGAGTGFDTGLVVDNTSVSPTIWPSGTTGTSQTGTVSLWFTGTQAGTAITNAMYPAGTTADPPIVLPAGCSLELIMSLGSSLNCASSVTPAGEGKINVAVTTGFVGYIIATTTFQYCHGVAYVSPMDNPLSGSYYEAIELDTPFWARGIRHVSNQNRTGQFGESQGH